MLWILRWFAFPCVGFFLWETACADKYFAHSAVGRSGDLEAEVSIVISARFERGLRGQQIDSAEGRLKFLDVAGEAKAVRVSGEGLDQIVSEFNYDVGPGKVNAVFDIRGEGEALETFWVQVEETKGSVRGTLTFRISQAGERITDATVFASESLSNSVVTVNPGRNDRAGLAIANPNDGPVSFYVIAVDAQENSEVAELTLPARGQMAGFVDELFPHLGSDFSGFLAVASARELVSVALNQNGETADLSALETYAGEESAVPLPVAVGRVFDLFSTEDFLGASISPEELGLVGREESDSELQATGLEGGIISFNRGNEQYLVEIGPQGGYLSPVLGRGVWEVRVEVPGFYDVSQNLQFPRPRVDWELIPEDLISLEWLGETLLGQGRIMKPIHQLKFFFDRGGFVGEEVQAAQEAYQLWAEFALPQLGIEVENGEEILGGRVQMGNPAAMPLTVLVQADSSVSETTVAPIWDMETGETQGGVLKFNPNCVDCAEQVGRDLWALVFGPVQIPSERFLSDFGLSPIVTQFVETPSGFSATAIDRLYFRIIRQRPPLTEVAAEQERLPDDP